jgi:hypothetical protein
MILTVDKKKKFLITMLIIMGCATAINYGLYNVLNSYFKNSDTEYAYSTVQLNIIIVLTVIASVTVIMVILIPKENVSELMSKIEHGAQTVGANGNLGSGNGSNNSIEQRELTDEEKLRNMIDEDLSEGSNSKK